MKVKHLVVDSGPLIKNAAIHEIGENIYTVEEVVSEIKDKATKQRLQCLPYEIRFREPPSEIIKLVTEFSKKTGDYLNLSATDIKLLALTFLLEKENVGTEHLNVEGPLHQVVTKQYVPENGPPPIGFYSPHDSSNDLISENASLNEEIRVEHLSVKHTEDQDDDIVTTDKEKKQDLNTSNQKSQTDNEINDAESFSDSGTDSCDSDDEGWITPLNIETVKKEMQSLTMNDTSSIVACITTDFAMQNVLLQMRLKVVSVNGMQIRQLKTFILRCHACFKMTTIMTKKFCPNCGNQTLKRVSVHVNEDGTRSVQINFKKPINIRGARHSLAAPKGGKHGNNPILFEDQPIPQNKPARLALKKLNALDPDYVASSSPFAINDVYSRAANLGIRNRKSNDFHRKCPGRRKR